MAYVSVSLKNALCVSAQSARASDSIDEPLILAGGLSQENVADAITQLEPYAFDVCSGIRTNSKPDEVKFALFMDKATYL